MHKDSIRKKYLAKRINLTQTEVLKKSQRITKNLLKLSIFFKYMNVSGYLPIQNEIETKFIIEHLVKNRVNIYLPYFDGNVYYFCKFRGWSHLEKGPFGVLQPSTPEKTDVRSIDVAILPGVAFSKDGTRLGYGKGVFDKLLASSPALKIGLAYEFQIVDANIAEKYDLKMDFIVTESKVYKL